FRNLGAACRRGRISPLEEAYALSPQKKRPGYKGEKVSTYALFAFFDPAVIFWYNYFINSPKFPTMIAENLQLSAEFSSRNFRTGFLCPSKKGQILIKEQIDEKKDISYHAGSVCSVSTVSWNAASGFR
ncbi:MAG: hypothetical protein PHT11_07480, partial [Synergistaceae bacterium]|nr:hypothetical protein [Synergistaceae bacterium]